MPFCNCFVHFSSAKFDPHKSPFVVKMNYKILRPFIQWRLKANLEQTLLPKHKMIMYMGMRASVLQCATA